MFKMHQNSIRTQGAAFTLLVLILVSPISAYGDKKKRMPPPKRPRLRHKKFKLTPRN